MKIKRYTEFISEEIITGFSPYGNQIDVKKLSSKYSWLDKYKSVKLDQSNTFKDIFNNDPLLLKQFLQENMPYQNLKYVGAGSIGLAFEWLKSDPLPEEFWKENLIGEKTPDGTGKVIKLTANNEEQLSSKKMVELGDQRGFAKYYWIKEVLLPHNQQWSSTLGSPGPLQMAKKPIEGSPDVKTRLGDQLKWNKQEIIDKWISDKKEKDLVKMKKAYIVCLEKLEMLNEWQEPLAHTLHELYCRNGNENYSNSPNIDPLTATNEQLMEVWNNKEEYNKVIEQRLGKQYLPIFTDITDAQFLEFATKWCDIYKSGSKLGIGTSDIHGGNCGWRGSELVAFDCM